MEKITNYLVRSTVEELGIVKAWEEDILLPTYAIGEEEKNPMFLEKRVYQGSSGVVYPYAVIEKIYDEKKDKKYKALFLENNYIKVMILPELGGRVQMAYDKMRNRHFVYYNQVIKPALVGLTGPWISGGIEFNWPQHHRPSTSQSVPDHAEEKASRRPSQQEYCCQLSAYGLHGTVELIRGHVGFQKLRDRGHPYEGKQVLVHRIEEPAQGADDEHHPRVSRDALKPPAGRASAAGRFGGHALVLP